MFKNNSHRNFEWFEASFTKKIQHILNESNKDNISWVRDLFISILLTIIPLICELILSLQPEYCQTCATEINSISIQTKFIYIICICLASISILGLVIWIGVCIWKYNKAIQKFKSRIIPHTIKNKYSFDESVFYFDNDICNDLILSKHYITLSLNEPDSASKEFYLIEALHYYYKSIRRFNIVCHSHSDSELQILFSSDRAETDKYIEIVRLTNYLTLIKSAIIPLDPSIDHSIYDSILKYNDSFSIIVSTFNTAYSKLQTQLTEIHRFAESNNDLIQIVKEIKNY